MKLFILNILLLELTIQKFLVINLKKDNYNSNKFKNNNYLKNEEIMEILLYNNYFTLINVGKPKKEIKFFMSFNKSQTILTNSEFSKSRSFFYKYNNTTKESLDIFEFIDNKNYKIDNYHKKMK